MESLLGYFLIFGARILDVSLGTMRMLMIVKGKRVFAAIIGFFEVIIYIVALQKVVSGLGDVGNLIAYALGFASGNYVGIFIEEKIALGNLSAQVVLNEENQEVVDTLRSKGFGVTVLKGLGKEGTRFILNITLKRRNLKVLHHVMNDYHKEAFITTNDIRHVKGGYFSKIKKK